MFYSILLCPEHAKRELRQFARDPIHLHHADDGQVNFLFFDEIFLAGIGHRYEIRGIHVRLLQEHGGQMVERLQKANDHGQNVNDNIRVECN